MGGLTCFSLMLILQFLLPFNLRAISESISLATTTLLTRPLKSHSKVMSTNTVQGILLPDTRQSLSNTAEALKMFRQALTGGCLVPASEQLRRNFAPQSTALTLGQELSILPPSSPVNHLWRERSIERQSTSDIKRVNAVKCLLAEKWEPSRLGIKHFRM